MQAVFCGRKVEANDSLSGVADAHTNERLARDAHEAPRRYSEDIGSHSEVQSKQEIESIRSCTSFLSGGKLSKRIYLDPVCSFLCFPILIGNMFLSLNISNNL